MSICLDFVGLTTRSEGPHGAYVRGAKRNMGRTCGEPDGIELTAIGVELNGPRHVPAWPGNDAVSVCSPAPYPATVLAQPPRVPGDGREMARGQSMVGGAASNPAPGVDQASEYCGSCARRPMAPSLRAEKER